MYFEWLAGAGRTLLRCHLPAAMPGKEHRRDAAEGADQYRARAGITLEDVIDTSDVPHSLDHTNFVERQIKQCGVSE